MNRRKFIRNLVASCAVAGMLMGLPMPKRKGSFYYEYKCAFLPYDESKELKLIIFKRQSDDLPSPLSALPSVS